MKVVGVSYDSVETLKDFAEEKSIELSLLSDDGSATINAYEIRNEDMDGKKYGDHDLSGVPHPGTFVVNSEGVITAKLFLRRYQQRHSVDELLEAAKAVE
jgi:peroxiredoxin